MMNLLQYILIKLIRFLKECCTNLLHLFSTFTNTSQSNEMEMTHRLLTFESTSKQTSKRVRVNRQIAQGGFSYVYEATDADTDRTYALKRINCGTDSELVQLCRKEAKVHSTFSHPSLLKLLGFQMETSSQALQQQQHDEGMVHVCYMLFPYLAGGSLRDEITRRNLLPSCDDTRQLSRSLMTSRCFTQKQILNLFYEIVYAVKLLHDGGVSHCDLKLENILLDVHYENYKDDQDKEGGSYEDTCEMYGVKGKPVLMDFGSARPLSLSLTTRSDVLTLVEEASSHTTICYRPPELFEGGLRHGEANLDLRKVDVWSCGCILFGLMYGSSPFEIEFVRRSSSSSLNGVEEEDVKVVECTQLRVLGRLPRPKAHTEMGKRYGVDMMDLVEGILVQDRLKRPSVEDVLEKVEGLIVKCGGQKRNRKDAGGSHKGGVIGGFGSGGNDDSDEDEENLFGSLLR
mmetsp:Transcript_38762/g.58223  ORF Transcript_38762/g.58223 Transcript_38762/m.58223 type:complete len:458 (-) Transcript_38762:97-1470(-)